MPNVINLQDRAPRSHGRLANEGADVAELASCIDSLKSRARGEIASAVLMLDLAAQHARQIEKRMYDPFAKRDFDAQITTIERLLRVAQEMALKL